MKPTFLIATLAAATVLSACGDKTQNVARTHTASLGFGEYGSVHSDGTSARSSLDLLSLN